MAEDFDAVYRQHYELVYRFALRLCGEASLAEEIAQETFYLALRNYAKFRGDSSLATWLCGIAKRVYWTNVKRPRALPLEEESQRVPGPDIEDREVFTLRTFCDLSHAEIASLFGKTESWARVTYYRARQMLQKAMEEADDDDK